MAPLTDRLLHYPMTNKVAGALVRPKGRYFQGRMVYCLPPGEGHDFAQSHRPEHYGIAPDARCDHLPDLLNLLITHYHAHIGRGEKLWELEELWDRSTVFGLISGCGPRQWRHFCSTSPSGGFIAPTTSTILGSCRSRMISVTGKASWIWHSGAGFRTAWAALSRSVS